MAEEPWWENTIEGTPLLVAFVKVVRDEVAKETLQQWNRFVAGVEYVAHKHGAAQPLSWSNNEVLLIIQAEGPQELVRAALSAAESIRERALVDLSMSVRLAVHAARVDWTSEREALAPHEVVRCEQLARATPSGGIGITEDVFLALADTERGRFSTLGGWAQDGQAAYVFPASLAPKPEHGSSPLADDLGFWRSFRRYVDSPAIRRLRYVGFPLQKKHPPSLDIREVFVPPEVRRLADRVTENAWPTHAWKREDLFLPREPLGRLVKGHRGLVVLGDPGSGKTTALRWLAVLAAGGPLAWAAQFGTAEQLLPLLVSVGRLAQIRSRLGEDSSVPQVLANYFQERGVGDAAELRPFLTRTLRRGTCLVLLDGLDEVQSETRNGVLRWLEAFCILFPRNRFVVSARWVGYSGFALPEGVEVEVGDFQDEQIRQYVQAFERACWRWENEGASDEAGAQHDAARLLEALFTSSRLRELARNPFMLSALALIRRAEGRLPRHRVQAYETFARTLCETWGQARRVVASETSTRDIRYEEEAIPILGQLALQLHEHWPAGVAPEVFVIRTLTDSILERQGEGSAEAERSAREFLARAGRDVQILLERGAGQWGFLHLTFQEFFTAVGLLSADEFEFVVFEHLLEPRWEEIIRLGVGYMALIQKRAIATQKFIRRVLTHKTGGSSPQKSQGGKQVYLAALLASEAGDVLPPSLQGEIAKAVVEWLHVVPEAIALPLLRELALTEFAERLLDEVLSDFSRLEEAKQGASILALGLFRGDRSREALRRLARARSGEVRSQVATGIVKGSDPMDWETLRLLIEGSEEEVRRAALAGFLSSRDASQRDASFELLLSNSRAEVLGPVIQTLALLQSLSAQRSRANEIEVVQTEVVRKAIRRGTAHQDSRVREEALALLRLEREHFPEEARAHSQELESLTSTERSASSTSTGSKAEEEQKLHERVLQGDPVIAAGVMQAFLEPIKRSLMMTMKCDRETAHDVTIDTLLSYLANPDLYDPSRGLLSVYLKRRARHRVMDQFRSSASQARRERDFASMMELMTAAPRNRLEDSVEASHSWERILGQGILRGRDMDFFQLLLSGEGSTQKLFDVLGLPAAPPEQMQRTVKRYRDRIMKTLSRLAKDDGDESS